MKNRSGSALHLRHIPSIDHIGGLWENGEPHLPQHQEQQSQHEMFRHYRASALVHCHVNESPPQLQHHLPSGEGHAINADSSPS
jgi:hypothetical protein